MGNAIVRLDNIAATKNGTFIKSVKLNKELQNGSIVEIGGLVTGEREMHVTATPKVTTTYFGMLTTPEIMYDEKKQIKDFINTTEKPARATILQKGDIFSVTVEAFTETPIVGKIIELGTTEVMKVVATATVGSTVIGKVVEIDIVGTNTFYVVEVQ